jgi:hypothetical protein
MGTHEIAMIMQQLSYANKQQRYWNARVLQLQDALTDELESLPVSQAEVPGP